MRSVFATVLQIAGVVGLVVAAFMWCLPAGVAATAFAVGAAGYVADPTR